MHLPAFSLDDGALQSWRQRHPTPATTTLLPYKKTQNVPLSRYKSSS